MKSEDAKVDVGHQNQVLQRLPDSLYTQRVLDVDYLDAKEVFLGWNVFAGATAGFH